MNITEHAGIIPESGIVGFKRVFEAQNEVLADEAELISEYLLLVYINDRLSGEIVCTPCGLPELVTGHLITETGITPEDIISIDICRLGHTAKVTVKDEVASRLTESVENTPTCCTDNATRLKLERKTGDLTRITGGSISKSAFPSILEKLSKDTKLHLRTRSAHSCFLVYDNEIIYEAEDIGRHNAVDKAVGYLAVNEADASHAALFTTGRMPIDMVRKVIRAKIPVLISKQQPTVESVELAREYDLTLIGNLRDDHFDVYNGISRIV